MRDGKAIVYLAVIVLFFAGVILLNANIAGVSTKTRIEATDREVIDGKIATVSEMDCHIYWIGDCPDRFLELGDKITVLTKDDINENNLPIQWSQVNFSTYNSTGELNSQITPRDYASKMFIVVNSVDLSEESLDILHNCAVLNGVPVLLISNFTVGQFRTYINWTNTSLDAMDTMLFSTKFGSQDNPFSIENITEVDFVNHILDIFIDIFGREITPVIMTNTPTPTPNPETGEM